MAWISPVVDYIRRLVMPLVNEVVIAVFTFFIGLIVGRILGRVTRRVLHSFDVDKTLARTTSFKVSAEGIAEVVVSFGVYFSFLIIALNQLGLTQWVLIGVSGVAGVIGVVGLVLALRDMIPNAIAGLVIMRRQLPSKGDRVRIDQVEGKVVDVSLLETRIKTRQGDSISFPSRQLLRSRIQVVSKKNRKKD